jgi:anti-sigma B factor antagonist
MNQPQVKDQEPSASMLETEIGLRAYGKWIARGQPSGTQLQDWLEAEAEVGSVGNPIMDGFRHFGVREHEGLIVVDFKEHPILDAWATNELDDELCDIAGQADCRNVLLNFSDVTWLASAVLAILVKVHRTMESKGGKLTLCGVGPGIQEIFAVTRLDQLFDISSNEAAIACNN